ncbi:metallophosphoesterase, partial [Caballeronia sp. BR00000012568055]|uniref:metallophosphoesterase family protein n=1 Tax=Caballeronia sp. BR00000012568055 TaxID=2918761 RepID=UPI0023F81639
MLDYLLNQAQSQATDLLNGNTSASPVHNILANVKSLLMHAQVLPSPTGGVSVTTISDEGDLVGRNQYESLDTNWSYCVVNWLSHFSASTKAPFRTAPPQPTPPLLANASITIAGDWGTGTNYRTDHQLAPSGKVAQAMSALKPDYTVHLGDVYYSGSTTEEQNNFISAWPAGKTGSFTLNSNHEMYSGAVGYYGTLDNSNMFEMQGKNSYFAVANQDWLIIGLDTAYHASELQLYQNGVLDDGQVAFIDTCLSANPNPKRVILLTHHNGLSLDGTTPTALWQQVSNVFVDREVWWYWGHMHAGVVYCDRDKLGHIIPASAGKSGVVHPRCAGHGAIPAGEPSLLVGNPAAIWHESHQVPDVLYSGRVANGFVFLSLNGGGLTESFVNEDGLTV